MPANPLKRPPNPAGGHWELVCSEKSRPFAIETFRLKVPNGWIYCNTITREMNFHSLWFLYPMPADRHSHIGRVLIEAVPPSVIARADEDALLAHRLKHGGE